LLRQRYSVLIGKLLQRFEKRQAFDEFNEFENIALGIATETAEILVFLRNGKRGRLLVVKWTEP
jgi:hypothetical protein